MRVQMWIHLGGAIKGAEENITFIYEPIETSLINLKKLLFTGIFL